MAWHLVGRFAIGALVVSAFAMLADSLRPKSFAGLFGAAPSVALASLALTVWIDGRDYAARECRSMIAGAGAFVVYSFACTKLLAKFNISALKVTLTAVLIWLSLAVSVWFVMFR